MAANIIVDSSGLVSLLINSDSNHDRALQAVNTYSATPSTVLIPHDVFTESINVLGKKFGHIRAGESGEKILASSLFHLMESDKTILHTALEKLQTQAESISYTDCIVMVFADRNETKQIFGFDDVFKKNGYQTPE
jgi:predicted nucleic acid-binding protein